MSSFASVRLSTLLYACRSTVNRELMILVRTPYSSSILVCFISVSPSTFISLCILTLQCIATDGFLFQYLKASTDPSCLQFYCHSEIIPITTISALYILDYGKCPWELLPFHYEQRIFGTIHSNTFFCFVIPDLLLYCRPWLQCVWASSVFISFCQLRHQNC